jgi:cobalt-zinc-cadmium efflux system outer membrane protein
MNFNIKKSITLIALSAFSLSIFAQTDITNKRSINFNDFLHRLGQDNLSYTAELLQLDIDIAEAENAKIFQDPTLSFEATDNGQRKMQMGYEFESSLEWTLELGGKRKARIGVAENRVELTKALLSDYFKNLRADATLQFLNAIKEKNILNVKVNSYETIKKLATSDSIRFELGDIMEIDARQSKLEATSLLNEVIQQEADWKNALYEINNQIGYQEVDSLYLPEGQLVNFDRSYQLPNLITLAEENRSDLKAAIQDKYLSQNLLKLIKAKRRIDIGLSIGVGNATIVTNTIAPTPAFTSVTAGIAIPLKLSNKNKGELKAAQYAIQQSEISYKASEINIKTEVYQAYAQYEASKQQIKQFDIELLKSAQRILDGKTYSYQRGETSLLEVLNAQRTFNEIQENYHETQYKYGASLIELQRVIGIWDVNL